MIRTLILSSLFFMSVFANAGNHGPCKINSLHQSASYSKYMLVKMECNGTNLATTCTNIHQDLIAFDITTEEGKIRSSILLAAFMAGKDVRISTYGACPAEIPNVPNMYGVIVQ